MKARPNDPKQAASPTNAVRMTRGWRRERARFQSPHAANDRDRNRGCNQESATTKRYSSAAQIPAEGRQHTGDFVVPVPADGLPLRRGAPLADAAASSGGKRRHFQEDAIDAAVPARAPVAQSQWSYDSDSLPFESGTAPQPLTVTRSFDEQFDAVAALYPVLAPTRCFSHRRDASNKSLRSIPAQPLVIWDHFRT